MRGLLALRRAFLQQSQFDGHAACDELLFVRQQGIARGAGGQDGVDLFGGAGEELDLLLVDALPAVGESDQVEIAVLEGVSVGEVRAACETRNRRAEARSTLC